ncbi:MAG: DNA-3-methyladenine glycosylase I [Deltaproteobacteria bacterium]|nr:DNA-3-methyladenine glycosylase I [Deltaproteobacteria bacterium]MBW1875099.1 DNA-3-methyladenine glycosylase I [Deltaproteobacteria bacterium]MBW2210220.1 DNA-3-methyladenine glycosylase I [Deltaproteobacteria bacterium]MBW2551635.1 DNA-3-methyladenine glycosylase I [Deltaproteobacteria bacterium]MBW2626638.1 DNA-3-methyladenine glycosylase I [Deltaproteobacteria bacterium]
MSRLPKGLVRGDDDLARCWWGASAPDYAAYHDEEWGWAVRDDRRLFEKICLEGFQSGLSWLTILRKRENFRKAFAGFDYHRVARFNQRSVGRLLNDAGIVRHRGKIESTINNAKRAIELEEEFGSLSAFFWEWVPPKSERPRRMTQGSLMKLAKTPTSTALSKELKGRGWSFVGPTTAYAFMQAMGLVNDHLEGCFVRERIARS